MQDMHEDRTCEDLSVTATKPKKRSFKVYSPTSGPSSVVREMEHSMNYWLEKISPEDMTLLWKGLAGSAKAANRPTFWLKMVSGTTSKVGLAGGVIAYTTENGFVLAFIEEST